MRRFGIPLFLAAVLAYAGLPLPAAAESPDTGLSKGPLLGKTTYAPFFVYYGLTGLSAAPRPKGEITFHVSSYLSQSFKTYMLPFDMTLSPGERSYPTELVALDFESTILELGISGAPGPRLEVGLEMRGLALSGGFLDAAIENFHNFVGLPNAGREYFAQDRLHAHIETANGLSLDLEEGCVSLADLDLWAKYLLARREGRALALLAAVKLPTGSHAALSGSGWPDLAAGLLFDTALSRYFSLYLQAAIVLPLDLVIPTAASRPWPMAQGMAAAEWHPSRAFSLVAQWRISSSPYYLSGLPFCGDIRYDQMTLPMLDLLVGCVFQYGDWRFQLYMEEDPFFYQGTDFTINASVSRKLAAFGKSGN